jgi:hypothetical protein
MRRSVENQSQKLFIASHRDAPFNRWSTTSVTTGCIPDGMQCIFGGYRFLPNGASLQDAVVYFSIAN